MDTSIGQALIIIAGVLVAMLVIGFVTQTFMQTSMWASAQDQEQVIEQVQKFNKEWEAYDKDLMYGVDVISCLNKAKSNNDKINGKYSEALDSSYEIKVIVNLKNDKLSESLTVYHIANNGSDKELAYTNGKGPQTSPQNYSKQLEELNLKFLKSKYSNLSNTICGKKNMDITTIEENQIKIINPLKLTKDIGDNENSVVNKLLSASDAVSQIVKNTDYESRNNENGWTKLEFKSALYDLKIKKFKCDSITYKADYGIVDTITFEEL